MKRIENKTIYFLLFLSIGINIGLTISFFSNPVKNTRSEYKESTPYLKREPSIPPHFMSLRYREQKLLEIKIRNFRTKALHMIEKKNKAEAEIINKLFSNSYSDTELTTLANEIGNICTDLELLLIDHIQDLKKIFPPSSYPLLKKRMMKLQKRHINR